MIEPNNSAILPKLEPPTENPENLVATKAKNGGRLTVISEGSNPVEISDPEVLIIKKPIKVRGAE